MHTISAVVFGALNNHKNKKNIWFFHLKASDEKQKVILILPVNLCKIFIEIPLYSSQQKLVQLTDGSITYII